MKVLLPPSAKTQEVGTRPEVELLLCCARTQMELERAGRIRNLLQEDIDWTYLIQTAHKHRLMPLLYWNINNICPEAVPKAVLDELRNDFHANTQRCLFLTRRLIQLLNLLEANRIPAIPFKGSILAASVYGNLSLRQFVDIDILVHKRDVLKTKDLLISQGYQSKLELSWEYHFISNNGRVNVDLHWEISPRYFSLMLSLEDLWERLEPGSFAGTTILNFSPEDLLLILCVNGAGECWQRLDRICDVAELIRIHQRMNCERVMEQASRMGIQRMLFLGLLLASYFLDTDLPEEVLQRIQADPAVKPLVAQVRELLFSKANNRLGEVERFTFYIKIRERLRDRLWYFVYLMHQSGWITPSNRDQEFLALPAYLSFLHYLVRPLRVVRRYGFSPLKHFLGF